MRAFHDRRLRSRMDISATRPAAFVTTAEDAASILATDGCPKTAAGIQQTLREIRARRPTLVPYLTHPNIILGIANGRCGPTTLVRWLICSISTWAACVRQIDSSASLSKPQVTTSTSTV